MTLEGIKTARILAAGLESEIRRRAPAISAEDRARILKHLEGLCVGMTSVDQAAACMSNNLDQAVSDYESGKL